jgi:hypothetical protein
MPRKLFLLISLVLVVAFALVGCGTATPATTAPVKDTPKPADTP